VKRIITALLVSPIVLLGMSWGIIWISFSAGKEAGENILDTLLNKP
jgi:hypothetical protein